TYLNRRRVVASYIKDIEDILDTEDTKDVDDIFDTEDGEEDEEAEDGIEEVLIFDQFEEILTVDPSDEAAQRQFFTQVGKALQDRSRRALFAMREEFVASLDPFRPLVPTRLDSTYRLDLLRAPA